MNEDNGLSSGVDADQFLALSDGLKRAFAALDEAGLGEASRSRWQRRLLAITTTAKRDLPRALSKLEAFEQDFAREHRPRG